MTTSLTSISSNFLNFQSKVILILEQDIESLFANITLPSPLKEACHYAMTGQGKRVRPLLVASTFSSVANIYNLASDNLFPAILDSNVRRVMLAVELLHTYSLVHDDLPCMDDDELRRGRATTHIEFDEATAMLVGDVLQTLAFEVLSRELNEIPSMENIAPTTCAELISIFAPRARRMVSGQMLDLEGENKSLDQSELQAIHRDKTGALIEAAVLMGATCAGIKNEQLNELTVFAQNLGLAFQVQDDILDVTVDTSQLGKPSGSDEKLDKSTYVKLMGVEQAREYAKQLFDDGKASLKDMFSSQSYGGNDTMLMQLADWMWERKK